jgi:hypothetical protein
MWWPGYCALLIDQDLSLVFYDLTTIRASGLNEQSDDLRRYSMAKSGLIERQFMLGVVQTAEGLPIYHEVFDRNQAESPTLLPMLKESVGGQTRRAGRGRGQPGQKTLRQRR